MPSKKPAVPIKARVVAKRRKPLAVIIAKIKREPRPPQPPECTTIISCDTLCSKCCAFGRGAHIVGKRGFCAACCPRCGK